MAAVPTPIGGLVGGLHGVLDGVVLREQAILIEAVLPQVDRLPALGPDAGVDDGHGDAGAVDALGMEAVRTHELARADHRGGALGLDATVLPDPHPGAGPERRGLCGSEPSADRADQPELVGHLATGLEYGLPGDLGGRRLDDVAGPCLRARDPGRHQRQDHLRQDND
jgi:hypothetical protein